MGVHLRSALASVLVLAAHAQATAQVSGSVAIVSDYVYRGISLSEGKAAPQLTLVYDHPDGWYLAGFVSNSRRSGAQYIGYAQRLSLGSSWEAGVSNHAASDMNFQEVFAGLAGERVSARVSYAPNYLGQGVRTVYGEVNASLRLGDKLNLFGHAGYFASLSDGWGKAPIRRADARIGLGFNLESWEFQLAWAGAHQRRAASAPYAVQGSDSVVLNVMRRF
jgi:uncharacterized protein (TIGR02001 family)